LAKRDPFAKAATEKTEAPNRIVARALASVAIVQ
jgi:hypothetical protein